LFKHSPGASRRQPWPLGSARRTARAVRWPRLLRRGLWRRPPLRIAPGRRGPIGRRRRRPTARSHRKARPVSPQPRPGSTKPAARRPAAGKTADSIGGDGPSRYRSRRDRTSGRDGGERAESRLPTLVGSSLFEPATPRIIGGRVACTTCQPGNYAARRDVLPSEDNRHYRNPRAQELRGNPRAQREPKSSEGPKGAAPHG